MIIKVLFMILIAGWVKLVQKSLGLYPYPKLRDDCRRIKVLFVHQLMHKLKYNIEIYMEIYIKTAPTCFGAVTPSLGSALFINVLFIHQLMHK
jgi:hypothetical protein